MDREDRAAWRNVRMAEIQAEAEEKKRADEIQMAKVKDDIELAIRDMELKGQAQASADANNPPSPNRDAKSSKLPAFMDEKDELDSYLLRFERYAENAKLSALLLGKTMNV